MAAFDRIDLMVLGLSFGVPTLLAAVIVGIVYYYRHRPEPPPLLGADGVVRLSGQLTSASTLVSFRRDTFGSVEVTHHELIWRSLTGQEWRVPIRALLLRPSGMFTTQAGVEFEAPYAGRWWLQVSDDPISPLAGDFGRRLRYRRAEELRYVLMSRGARMVAR